MTQKQVGIKSNEMKRIISRKNVCFSTENRYTVHLMSIQGIMGDSIKECTDNLKTIYGQENMDLEYDEEN